MLVNSEPLYQLSYLGINLFKILLRINSKLFALHLRAAPCQQAGTSFRLARNAWTNPLRFVAESYRGINFSANFRRTDTISNTSKNQKDAKNVLRVLFGAKPGGLYA